MKTITKEELNERIRLHGLWLAKDPNGVKLDLSYHDLSHKDLRGSDLRYAAIQYAALQGANLQDANLHNTIGNGKEILTLQTNKWHVNIVHPTKIIWVGCKSISFEDFFALTKTRAEKIHAGSWDWVKIWRPTIRKMAKEGVK